MDTRKRRKEGTARTPSLESLQASPKRARVHAQRKFAQGSQPNSPAPTPVKETRELRERSISTDTRTRATAQTHPPPPPALDIVEVPGRPTVEDFLTFLCYRGTSLLPPGLEHFNTPQILEISADSRSQSPARDDKNKPTKKKQDAPSLDKKEKELSKEAVKKNLDQTTEAEGSGSAPVRVTRSTPQPHQAPSDSSRKLSKRLLVKKALLIKSKAKNLRIQERKSVGLRRSEVLNSSNIQASVVATRSGRLLHKYRVSATTAMARKKARVAKLSSIRPKQKLSRILQRLGGSVSYPENRPTRVTRSKVEGKEEATNEKSNEDEDPKEKTEEEKQNEMKEETSKVNSPDAAPAGPSSRLMRKKEERKKFIMKRVVKVRKECKTASPEEGNITETVSTKPVNPSPPTPLVEEVPMSKRLRRSTQETTTPQTPQKKTSPSSSAASSPSALQIPKKSGTSSAATAVSHSANKKPSPPPSSSSPPVDQKKSLADTPVAQSSPQPSHKKSLQSQNSTSSNSPTPQQKKLSQPSAAPSPPSGSSPQQKKTSTSTSAASTPQKKGSPASSPGSPSTNRKTANTRESRRGKESSAPVPVDTSEHVVVEEADANTGVRARPSRRTKEAATVYLELIGRKLAQESKSKQKTFDEEDEDEEEDDDAISVSSIMDLKALAKSRGREAEQEEKKKLKPQESSASESARQTRNTRGDRSPSVDTTSPKTSSLRKSLRKSRESSDQVDEDKTTKPEAANVEAGRVTRRTPSVKDESSNSASEDRPSTTTRRSKKVEKIEASSPDEEPTSIAPSPAISQPPPAAPQTSLPVRVVSRSLRRTRSDADEPKKKESHPSSRRASLELDSSLDVTGPRRVTRGRDRQDYKENESDNEDIEKALKNTRAKLELRRIQGGATDQVSSLKDETEGEGEDKSVKMRTRRAGSDEKVENKGNMSKGSEKFNSRQTTSGQKLEKDNDSKIHSDTEITLGGVVSAEVEKKDSQDSQLDNKIVNSDSEKVPGPGSKSRRTVSQERKEHLLSRDSSRLSAVRRSADSSDSIESSEISETVTRPNNRGKGASSTNHMEISSLDTNEKRMVGLPNKRKAIGGRRRSSNHDEAKLNEVLESVAKDFERDIDDDHYDRLEKDFMLGNKSPEKVKGEKSLITDKEDLNVSESSNSCMDDSKSTSSTEFGIISSVSVKASSVPVSQPGSSSPNPNRRSANSRKLCDVVRSLQKKQAESPSTVTDAEKPTFLKDLNNWSSDKSRQVSPQSGHDLQSSGTTSAPTIRSQSDTTTSETVHSPSAPSTPENTTLISSKAPSQTPKQAVTTPKAAPAKASTNKPFSTSPTSSPITSHNPAPVVTVTSCSPALAPTTTVTSSLSNATVSATTDSNTVLLGMSSASSVQKVVTSASSSSVQTASDEHLTVMPSIPVSIKPSVTVNVTNSGFSSPVTMSRVQQLPCVTVQGSVASSKAVELAPVKGTPKQLHIAPKPVKTPSSLTTSAPAGQVSISVLPPGTQKQMPKPVQIAPKPPAGTSHNLPNTQLVAPQPGHMMQAQVQAQVQAIPQQVQTVQAIPQPVQTLQAIPQPVQTVQTLTPPMQTVTAMPMQAVMTQSLIDPTQLVTPSSPAKIITQPIFVTSSMQSAVTYSISPQAIGQSHLPGNVSAVARVLTPTMVGKVAAKPQPHLMTPKVPGPLVTFTTGAVGGTSAVRPIVPLPQQVQAPQQPQILAVSVMPVGSTHVSSMPGQAGLIPGTQGPMITTGHPTGQHHAFIPVTAANQPQSHSAMPITQAPVCASTSASQVPIASDTSKLSLSSTEIVMNSHVDGSTPSGAQSESVPLNQQNKPVVADQNLNTSVSPVTLGNTETVSSLHSNTNNSNPSSTIDAITVSAPDNPHQSTLPVSKENNVVPVVAGVKGASAVKADSSNSAQACKVVENAFRSGIPGNIKITEISKGGVRSNGPVHIANVKPKVTISQMPVRPQMATPSVTITTLNDTPQSIKQSIANGSKMASSFKQTSTTSSVALKLTSSVSVVQHKSGMGRNFVAPSHLEKETFALNPITIVEKDKAGNIIPNINAEREAENSSLAKTDKDDTSPVAQDKSDTSSPDIPVSVSPASHKTYKEDQGGMLQVKAEKGKNTSISVSPFKMQELRTVDKVQNVNGKNPGNMEKSQEKKNSDKKKEPLLKRTLFKTKSQEEKKPPGMSPVYRTKSQEEKKTSNAFSPLHESSVYAFEPDFESSPLEETSPFSQRIKNIQPSPGTSPVKPNNTIKPQLPTLHLNKPPAKAAGLHTPARSPVARSLAPMIAGRPKSSTGTSPTGVNTPTQPAPAGKRPGVTTPPAPLTKAASIGTETVNKVSQGEATPTVSKASEDQMKVGAECETSSSGEGVAKKSVSSTSIAIQCDMDEGMDVNENGVRANESGTQTEGPSKFPLPPTASPFYYLPLAMAALGEKLPAQLVQQMLAKTQGLVGAAEAGMILQQAAQLAQQQKLQQQGTPGATPISSTSAVKPIKPSSIPGLAVAPLLSGTSGNPNVVSVNLLRPVGKAQESSSSGSEISVQSPVTVTSVTSTSPGNTVTTCTSSTSVPLPAVTTHCNTTSTSAPAVTTLAPASTSQSPVTARPGVSRIDAKPTHIPPHRPQPTPSVQPSEEVSTPSLCKPSKLGKQKEKEDSSKTHTEEAEPPARRRSGRASTSATTRATESDMLEIEELRRNRRAKRAAAALAREEGWSSSSEAPLSPQMSPDTLRGWPPPRLTSPTPSQSSEGTTSSTPSQRSNRLSSRSRRQSPASNSDSRNHGKSSSGSTASSTPSSQASGSSSTVNSDKSLEEPNAKYNCDNSILVRAPSFFPSEEEFTDPLDYIEKIRPEAEQFGLCRIVPPGNFKPECRVNDDMRFTANNQYIHKMMRRWGPNVRTLHAIKKCLAKQNIELNSNPLIGCMELDLVRLYEVVEQHGGLMSVIEKELWGKVADACRIPRSAQERLAKLDFIYCKYLLPYATLSQDERDQLLAEVDRIHNRNQLDQSGASKKTSGSSDNEEEEEEESLDCIVKGKSTALSTFFRIARNTSTQWQPDPAALEVDERYWSLVVNGNQHVCVLSASIDTSEHGYGFPNHRLSPLTKHPWNLKNLCQNPNSILRSMGTIVGVTAPTLHVGMLFSTVCWYRDPHSLPWIEYLHTGASKIWYGVAANQEDKLCAALKKIVPDFIKDSAIWLPSDTAMVPPSELVREGVRVCRIVQEPGQFVVVFPGAFTSSVCTGYLISESAFFARPQYFDRALMSFKALHECCEPSMFSLDRLVLSVITDPRVTLDGLLRARELALQVVEKEKRLRAELSDIGLQASERLSTPDSHRKKKSRFIEDEEENMCEVCRQNLYVALVTNSQEEAVYCLEHALIFLKQNPTHLEYCKLMYTYSLSELDIALKQMDERIHIKSGKKSSPNTKRTKTREHLDSVSSTSSSNL